ncbi:MAG: GAF domain-containing protein [Paracoccaceae bacterium]
MSALLHHAEHVMQVVQSGSAAAHSRLAASWRRSMMIHSLDPASTRKPHRLECRTLRDRLDASGAFLEAARPELDALFQIVGMSGCSAVLTDPDGIILEQRSPDGDATTFASWGLCTGFDWSEQMAGTNGIGTCLSEVCAVTIHKDEHFLYTNRAMSCIGAPIFGADGALVGALDVSSARADQTVGMNCLLAAAAARFANVIEARLFRATFPQSRIVMVGWGDVPCLVAVDPDDLVIGATRAARRKMDLGTQRILAPIPLADLAGQDGRRRGIEGAEYAALRRALVRSGGNAAAAARALGLSRTTLYRRMKRVGLEKDDLNLFQN